MKFSYVILKKKDPPEVNNDKETDLSSYRLHHEDDAIWFNIFVVWFCVICLFSVSPLIYLVMLFSFFFFLVRCSQDAYL